MALWQDGPASAASYATRHLLLIRAASMHTGAGAADRQRPRAGQHPGVGPDRRQGLHRGVRRVRCVRARRPPRPQARPAEADRRNLSRKIGFTCVHGTGGSQTGQPCDLGTLAIVAVVICAAHTSDLARSALRLHRQGWDTSDVGYLIAITLDVVVQQLYDTICCLHQRGPQCCACVKTQSQANAHGLTPAAPIGSGACTRAYSVASCRSTGSRPLRRCRRSTPSRMVMQPFGALVKWHDLAAMCGTSNYWLNASSLAVQPCTERSAAASDAPLPHYQRFQCVRPCLHPGMSPTSCWMCCMSVL